MRKATLMQYKTLLKKLDAAPEDHSLVYVHPDASIESVLAEFNSIADPDSSADPSQAVRFYDLWRSMLEQGRIQLVAYRKTQKSEGNLPRDAFGPRMMCRVVVRGQHHFFQLFTKAQEPWHVNGS